jgi:hypothetical protein
MISSLHQCHLFKSISSTNEDWIEQGAEQAAPTAPSLPRPKSSSLKPAHELLHKQAVESLPPPILPSPDVMVLLNKKPMYEHIRRNVWVATDRPRRMAKDDIAVCSCRPPRQPPINLHPAPTWPQAMEGRKLPSALLGGSSVCAILLCCFWGSHHVVACGLGFGS